MLPFRARGLGGDGGDLVRDEALGAGGIIGRDNEVVGGSALGQGDGDRGGIAKVGGLGVIAAGKPGVQLVAHGIGVGIAGCGIGVPS